MSTLYDYDRFAAQTEEAVTVKVFPDGETHTMVEPPFTLVLEVSSMLAERGDSQQISVAQALKCMELVKLAFPTMAANGEADRLSGTQLMRLVALVRDGELPEDLGPLRTAEGNAQTETAAATASSSPSAATPAPTGKTQKRSGAK